VLAKEERAQLAKKKSGFKHKLKWIFVQNGYFQRLFPTIREQKPGKDLYTALASFQILIIIYMIFFYT